MKLRNIIFLSLAVALSASCKADKASEPFFETRGVVIAWNDLQNPEVIDWVKKMHDNGINTVSVFGHDYGSPEYAEMRQMLIDEGFAFEYEEHAMSWLLPRDLFAEHPEYFRMDENGNRVLDGNGCPSCEEGLKVIMSNVPAFVEKHKPSNHKYYTWLWDGGDICHCEKCKDYNVADQGLIFENHIIKALKEIDPEAQLAHLAYHNSTPAPSKVKPEEGIFLEFAPFFRRWDKPLSDKEAIRDGQTWTHGDYIQMLEDNLKVFPAETAQVLEYWLDISLVSDWKMPQKQITLYEEAFLDDLKTYASYGIKHITTYACWADANYVEMYGDVSFIDKYGQGLLNYRHNE